MSHQHADRAEDEVLEIELHCPVESRVLTYLRNIASQVARTVGFEDEQIDQIEMAVDEACANVVKHAYGETVGRDGEKRHECVLKMRIVIAPDRLKFCIIDHGVGVTNKPRGANSVDEYLERGAHGGLGVYIIRNFMDEVEYQSPPGAGTTLTMTKYLRPATKTD